MTEELLPPDPSKDGWYWLERQGCIATPFKFFHGVNNWWNYDQYGQRKASDMWRWEWRLASPHPIPGPEQLDALHAWRDSLSEAANEIRDASA